MVTDTRGRWSDDSSVSVAEAWVSESFLFAKWAGKLVLKSLTPSDKLSASRFFNRY